MSLTLSSKLAPFPFSAIAIAAYTGKAHVIFDETAPLIVLDINSSIHRDEHDIVQVLAKEAGLGDASTRVCRSQHLKSYFCLFLPSQTPAYFTLAKTLKTASALPEINTALDLLDNYLAYHTFLVGHDISASDWAIWGAIRGS